MNPPVQIGCATLYEGDCLEVLPTLGTVDAVITDPPYGIESLVGAYGRGARNIAGDASLDALEDALITLNEYHSDFWALVFYSCRVSPAFFALQHGLSYFGEVIWDKVAPGMGNPLRYQHENIAIFKKGAPCAMEPTFSVLRAYRAGDVHPHEKPLSVMRRVCEILDANVILDPFMGSGTTGMACASLGRKFIGIEIEPKYFDIACKRIEDAYAQPDMFVEPPAKAEQMDLIE